MVRVGVREQILVVSAVACVVSVFAPRAGWAEGARAASGSAAALRPLARELSAAGAAIDPVPPQGQTAHGLYFNAPVQRRLGAKGIVRVLRGSGMNAAVLDLKDGEGRVNWDTQIASLRPQRHQYFKDMPGFIAELKRAGVYTIGRVVCFSDPYLPRNEPDRAVLDDRPGKQGKVWATWGKRNPWLDPYNPRNQQLVIDMAKEVEALGLDEIQFDYIRFPVDRATRFARFPAQVDTPRPAVLVGMLKRVDEAVRIPIGTDVFGVTAFHEGDRDGLGQLPEDWAAHVEVFTPMLYLDGMSSWHARGGNPRAEKLIYAGIKNLRRRLGNGPIIRPFLQAFARGADYYNTAFIAEQIRGAREAGADGFLFWSPGSSYRMVQESSAGAARGLFPFPIEERSAWRKQVWEANAPAAEDDGAAGVPVEAAATADATRLAAGPKEAVAIEQPVGRAPDATSRVVDGVTRASQARAGRAPAAAAVDIVTRPSQAPRH